MKILFYSVKDFEQALLLEKNTAGFLVRMTNLALSEKTAELAGGFDVISIFTGDDASAPVIERLQAAGVKFIAIRAAGYDNVDLVKAAEAHIQVANVPAYSPFAIAEHALALMLALDRKLITANRQVQQQNFSMNNLIGFNLYRKTVGIIGTGNIGAALIKLLKGFECRILAYDIQKNEELATYDRLHYVNMQQLCSESDIISIHTPLNEQTRHIINAASIALMKKGVMIINTSRGGCVDTEAVVQFLDNGHIGYFGADVYEKEKGLFFYDCSNREINDPVLKKLLQFPNVLITPHQAFATNEALDNIATTTFDTINCWAENRYSQNELYHVPLSQPPQVVKPL
ncbi:MAG: 2-hydroxyacid dehydrogenase [Chitinophagaceae bacterium]